MKKTLILGLEVQVEREDLYLRLRRVAEKLEAILNNPDLTLKAKLRAAAIIASITSAATTVIRDYQIAKLETEIEELESRYERKT